MDYDEFIAYAERAKKIWRRFEESFTDPEIKAFLKQSYAVLAHPRGQVSLNNTDSRAIALESPDFFVPNQASSGLVEHARQLEGIKKDSDERNRKERARIEKWFADFNPRRLKFEEPRLEVRFPVVKIEIIQRIKQNPFVDKRYTGAGGVSIRVVLMSD
jgi:hypothetical protein